MDSKDEREIIILKDCIVRAISPLKIYLFGSFANGTAKLESDYDFFVIVRDNEDNILELTKKAYKCMRGKKNRPVDIIVAKEGNFRERKHYFFSLEKEVYEKGVVLYDADLPCVKE